MRQGVNMRTCPQPSGWAPTSPRSNTCTSKPWSSAAAAASSPIGPAPMMASVLRAGAAMGVLLGWTRTGDTRDPCDRARPPCGAGGPGTRGPASRLLPDRPAFQREIVRSLGRRGTLQPPGLLEHEVHEPDQVGAREGPEIESREQHPAVLAA